MNTLEHPISVAIESTCRIGGLALGAGETLIEVLPFDASLRAATQVVARLDDLAGRHGFAPSEIGELYVSVGPGSFTGTRVGVTVARTLAQAALCKCVSVPTLQAVAHNAIPQADVQHLAVVLDAKHGRIFAQIFERQGQGFVPAALAELTTAQELLSRTPRPLHVIGEGLGYHDLHAEGVTYLPEKDWLPRAEGVWAVGRQMAAAGQFTDYAHLLPVYTGKPEAVRKWEERHGPR